MLDKFLHHISKNFPELIGKKLLLACSGGVDSMVLADLMLKAEHGFSLAHCNYKLRGSASDLDEKFVTSWGEHHGIPTYTKTFDLSRFKGSLQLEARNLRYRWFRELLNSMDHDYVLTAHHANDSLETFFINLTRGTGLRGLDGIPERNDGVLRPMLPFSRTEILQFAQENNIEWREDTSNADAKYLRNRIRHELTPLLEQLNPNFLSSLQKTQQFLHYDAKLLDDYTQVLKGKLFLNVDDAIRVPINELMVLEPLENYLYVLFKDYGFSQWSDIIDLMSAQSGKEIRSSSHRLIKDRNSLILSGAESTNTSMFDIDQENKALTVPINLSISEVKVLGDFSDSIIYVDKEKLNYPLKLRKWKIGDYFYPLGMGGTKKLSKFFKDEKYDALEKERQWLLCSKDEIIWVVGKRADERFKVDSHTKTILKFTLGQ